MHVHVRVGCSLFRSREYPVHDVVMRSTIRLLTHVMSIFMYYTYVPLFFIYLRTCIRIFVGSCLATKVFNRQIVGYGREMAHRRVGRSWAEKIVT